MMIDGAMFHLHEEVLHDSKPSPHTLGGNSVVLGLFVTDPGAVMKKALETGTQEPGNMQDYNYRYRQASFADPFGHYWTVQKTI